MQSYKTLKDRQYSNYQTIQSTGDWGFAIF